MSISVSRAPLQLPDDDWAGWLHARCRDRLDEVDRLAGELRKGSYEAGLDALKVWNDVQLALADTFAVCSLMSQVHPLEAVRTLAEETEQAADKIATALSLDHELFDLLTSVDSDPLDDDARRVLQRTLRDFRRAGVDRDEPTRQRLEELAEQATRLGQEFSKNIRDDVRSIRVSTQQLSGLPADYVEARPADEEGMHVITTDYPDAVPFLTFAADADARRSMHVAFLSRGWPANDSLVRDLLKTRAEQASLLGYRDWPDYDAEVKMIGDGAAIGAFIEQITAAAEDSGRRDRDILLHRLQRDQPEATTIDRADSTHYAELVRREQFDVDAQQIRAYFDFAKVRQGLLDVTGRLFGLDYEAVEDAPRWHEDVAVYDVHLEGELLGRIYLDLHPREGKYKHAAQFELAKGLAGRQLPEGVLVCNFPRGLMEHSDVVTLFHEFGHLVHHVLAGRHDWVRFSGVATEWDFVEAPSQMLEEWAWDAAVLRSFATNGSGEPIPVELVDRMRAGNEFGKAYLARTQMFYASVSYQLHRDRHDDLTAAVRQLQTTYDLFPYVEGTHFHASFGHLAGYSSAYYTYMWSLVIAKDLFSTFDPRDLFEPTTAQRYRDTVLAAGGSRDAAELVADFLGRPYDFGAFTRWLEAAD